MLLMTTSFSGFNLAPENEPKSAELTFKNNTSSSALLSLRLYNLDWGTDGVKSDGY